MELPNSTCLQFTAPTFVGLDESTAHIFLWIIYTVICQAVEVFGIVTNIINIICFVKQGLGDSINISLLGKGQLKVFFSYIKTYVYRMRGWVFVYSRFSVSRIGNTMIITNFKAVDILNIVAIMLFYNRR